MTSEQRKKAKKLHPDMGGSHEAFISFMEEVEAGIPPKEEDYDYEEAIQSPPSEVVAWEVKATSWSPILPIFGGEEVVEVVGANFKLVETESFCDHIEQYNVDRHIFTKTWWLISFQPKGHIVVLLDGGYKIKYSWNNKSLMQ